MLQSVNLDVTLRLLGFKISAFYWFDDKQLNCGWIFSSSPCVFGECYESIENKKHIKKINIEKNSRLRKTKKKHMQSNRLMEQCMRKHWIETIYGWNKEKIHAHRYTNNARRVWAVEIFFFNFQRCWTIQSEIKFVQILDLQRHKLLNYSYFQAEDIKLP